MLQRPSGVISNNSWDCCLTTLRSHSTSKDSPPPISSSVQDPVSITAWCHLIRYTIVFLVVDPMYHNSGESTFKLVSPTLIGSTGDVSDRDNYDLDQVKSIAKVEVRPPLFQRIS
jgi:hypothetical protein